MKKIRLVLFFMLLFMNCGLWTISYAQETLQILTYYPAPYGVYQTIQVGQPDHFLQIDYNAGTSSYRFYPTAPNSGSILIGRRDASGNINSNILIDGVGNILMGSPLKVSHDGTASDLYVGVGGTPPSGRVGIGTSDPQDILHVNGSIRIPDSGSYKINNNRVLYLNNESIVLNCESGQEIRITQAGNNRIQVGTNGYVGIGYPYAISDPPSLLAVDDILRVNDRVGIGTTAPVEKLEVAGGIKIGNTIQTPPTNGTILYDGNFKGKNALSTLQNLTAVGGTVGVTRIIHGSNITISSTGPNGTGKVTISSSPPPGSITGPGNAGYIAKYKGTPLAESTTIENSEIFQDASDNIGIGITTELLGKLRVKTSKVGNAIFGETNVNTGVYGVGPYGLYGLSQASGGYGVYGKASGNGTGVYGYSKNNYSGYFSGRIYVSGNVGIGTTNPTAKLHVNGNIKANLTDISNTTLMYYGISSHEIGRDIAELFVTNIEVEPCDVLVIDSDGKLKKNNKPYDTKIAGIVSSTPAILLEGSQIQIAPEPFKFQKGTKPPIALIGRVLANVSAENGSIEPGDLLTTSSTPGYAMKIKSIGEINNYPIYPQGCIIGKALEPLKEGKGKIRVLVCLM